MNCAFFILCEDDTHAGVDRLEMCVGHEPGRAITRHLHGVRLWLRANCLILGEVVHEWIVSARAHLADELGDEGAPEPLREGELQLIARVNDAVDDDPILTETVARGNFGEGFALHDKITA